MNRIRNAAIIGSFRQHYAEVCNVWTLLTNAGLEVTSPKGTPIVEEGIPFVRFTSDPAKWDDPMVQTVALHRILRAHFVYVVAPRGYVGRTTCYEIGRIIQSSRPIYFSEQPTDLPIRIPETHIMQSDVLVAQLKDDMFQPQPLFLNPKTPHFILEKELLSGHYRSDHELST